MNWLCVFFGPHAVQGSGTWDVVNSLISGTCSTVQIIREASGINRVWFLQLFYVLFACHNETVWHGDRRGSENVLDRCFPFFVACEDMRYVWNHMLPYYSHYFCSMQCVCMKCIVCKLCTCMENLLHLPKHLVYSQQTQSEIMHCSELDLLFPMWTGS